MDFHEHTMVTRSGIGFRVLAHDGTRPNYVHLCARYPQAPRTVSTLRDHLKWIPVPTPWYSVSWNWSFALRRAQWYMDNFSARSVVILMLDLEQLGPAVDAYAFAQHDDFPNFELFRGEHLYYGVIPETAILAHIPASSPQEVKNVCTGEVSAPGDLWAEAELLYRQRLTLDGDWRYIQAMREWLHDHIYARRILIDRNKVENMLESMFLTTWESEQWRISA